jgi:hypothetical protein
MGVDERNGHSKHDLNSGTAGASSSPVVEEVLLCVLRECCGMNQARTEENMVLSCARTLCFAQAAFFSLYWKAPLCIHVFETMNPEVVR